MMSTRQNCCMQCRNLERKRRPWYAVGALAALAWLFGCGDTGKAVESSTRGGIGGRAHPAVPGNSASDGSTKTSQATDHDSPTNATASRESNASAGGAANAGGTSAVIVLQSASGGLSVNGAM